MLLKEDDLRDYQIESIAGLREGMRLGHKHQILMAPTGAGKTVIASYLMQKAIDKGTRVAFVVDRVSLVDQTSATLDHYRIPHGVVQANHWRRRSSEPVQICSAQTIEKRGFFPDLGLLIVDECHAMRKATVSLIKSRPDLPVIGLSATPFTTGIGELYTNLVNVTTTNRLVDRGYLAPLKMYAAKAIDMTGAKVIAGEWAEKEIEERGKTIIGDIVAEWQDKTRLHFGGPVKTIVFSATVEHGEELCKQFNAAGYNFQQISYKDGSGEHRRALIDEFRKPDSMITGLVSCEVFTKGFDVPDILCGIAARPYRKSLSSHIQQMGRVMRTAPGKSFGLWLDHCGNVLRFKEDADEIFSNGLASLNEGDRDAKARKEPSPKEKKEIACSCGYVFPYRMDVCPACGKEHKRLSIVETVAGVMELVGGKPLPGFLADRKSVWRQIASLSMERKKGDVEAAKKFAKAQYMNIYQEWPKSDSMSDTEPCTLQVKNKVMGNLLRYVKGRAKAQRMTA